MWCESSWASEALQIGRGGAEDGSPHSCFSHSHFSETVDFISCRPHYRTLLSAFSLLWFSVLSLFFFLTCSSPGCLFLSRVSCCACFCDFYSPFFFFFLPFFPQLPLAAVTWQRSTWISQISPACQNKIHSVTGTFIIRFWHFWSIYRWL